MEPATSVVLANGKLDPLDAGVDPVLAPLPPVAPVVYDDPRDAYFDVSHLNKDLKKRTIRGGAVTLSSQAVKFVLRMGSTAVLARLLTPADFGLIAMVTVVTGFVEMFKDAGLSMATVQREKITHAQVSTLFWINIGLSVVIMFIIAALAPAIAWFYGDPRLTNITLALAGTMVFGGVAVQHQALLRRRMEFGKLAVIEIVSMAAGVVTAAAMAWNGWGYWSLVGITTVTALVTTVASLIFSGWVPGLPRMRCDVKQLVMFGGHLTGFSFINYFSRNADNFLIGWWWGPQQVGLYNRAYGLLLQPIALVNGPIASVAHPMLAKLQSEPDRFRRAFKQILKILAFLTIPSVAALLVVADAAVSVLLGRNWAPAVPIFIALGTSALFQSVYNATGWVLIAMGEGERYFRMSVLIAVPTLASFCIGLPYGAIGVAIAYAVVNVVLVCPMLFWYISRYSPVKMTDFYGAVFMPLILGCAVAGLLLFVRQTRVIDHPACLLLTACIFSAVASLGGVRQYMSIRRVAN